MFLRDRVRVSKVFYQRSLQRSKELSAERCQESAAFKDSVVLVLTRSNTQTSRTFQEITRARSSDSVKKALPQDRFPRTGHMVTSRQFWKQQRTHALRPCTTYLTCHP